MNKYQLYARIFPIILCSIPALIFQYYLLNQEIANLLQFLGGINFMGNFTISMAILYFISQTNRLIAKTFFEKNEICMPTTDFSLFCNPEFSEEYKKEIYKKIQDDFNIQLPTENEQNENELNSRKRIAEAMSLVRKKFESNKLLLQHNIEYGFWRNLIGGTIFAILFSGLDIYFALTQSNNSILIVSTIILIVCLVLLFFNRYITRKIGELYARVLIQEYMAN